MVDLDSFYRDFGMRTFFLPKSVKKELARSMPAALSGREQAGITGGYRLGAAGVAAQGGRDVATIGEKGALARRKLIEEGDLSLQGMKGDQALRFLDKKVNLENWLQDRDYDRQGRFLREHGDTLRNSGYKEGVATPNYAQAVDENLGIMRREDVEETTRNLTDRSKKNKPAQFSLSNLYGEEDEVGPLGWALPM